MAFFVAGIVQAAKRMSAVWFLNDCSAGQRAAQSE
jgi:hypothetical protein